mgnify:CR=1 FL=1
MLSDNKGLGPSPGGKGVQFVQGAQLLNTDSEYALGM